MSKQSEIQAEQTHLDHAYRRVAATRAAARAAMQDVLNLGKGGTFQSRTERDVVVRTSLARIEQFSIGDQTLMFGRIDQLDGERFYIGRLAVSGEDQEPLIIDWRAKVAEPFYRATGRVPMGLRMRRHFEVRARKILDIEDEPLTWDELTETGSAGEPSASEAAKKEGDEGDHAAPELVLSGEGALLRALRRSRSGTMGDIVATIQGEQDRVIRGRLAGVLAVQGGPGTGKTAVALHRAAYLLYTHRFPLEHLGVLAVGPNPIFLRYIGHVLPSLGESGVTLSTVSGLVRDAEVRGSEPADVCALKGDVRMANVLARAIKNRQRVPRHDLVVSYGTMRLTLEVAALRDIVLHFKRRGTSHNARRKRVEEAVLSALFDRYVELTKRTHVRLTGARTATFEEFTEQVRADNDVQLALDRMWPKLHAIELLHDLYGAMPLLKLACSDILRKEEYQKLYRERSASLADIPWTEADIALIDEARTLLGPTRTLREGELHTQTYGHVVVDEVQDLSPMQMRMIGRRSLNGSMTLVGDIAQATGVNAPRTWDELFKHLPSKAKVRKVELTIGYRTPAQVMAVAEKVLQHMSLAVAAPHPVRVGDAEPVFRRWDGRAHEAHAGHGAHGEQNAREELQRIVQAERAAVGDGTVGVLSSEENAPWLQEVVASIGQEATTSSNSNADSTSDLDAERISVLPISLAKGLEFDSVIIIEPSTLSMRELYVALTRTTNRLTVLYAEELPIALKEFAQ